MPLEIDRHRVRELVAKRTPLIDVFSAKAYKHSHIPQARSIPLPELDALAVAEFSKDAPIIVYCKDAQ